MKKVLFTVIVLLVFASWVQAAPYLVCDIYPAESQPTHYQMLVDGVAVQTPYGTVINGDSLVLDLQPYSNGAHQITAIQACNARGCSDPPLVYGVPGLPGQPALRLVP